MKPEAQLGRGRACIDFRTVMDLPSKSTGLRYLLLSPIILCTCFIFRCALLFEPSRQELSLFCGILVGTLFLKTLGHVSVRKSTTSSNGKSVPYPPSRKREKTFKQKIGAIVPCHKSEAEIKKGLQSLLIKGILPEHIYVMDNADSPVPPDDTKRVVRCIHPGIKYIFIPKGLKTFALWKATNDFPSTVKYILHLDDDTVLADSIRFNEATFDDPTVSSISYNIRVRDLSGRSSADSAASWLHRCIDFEFSLKNSWRVFQTKYEGTGWWAHGICGLWRREAFYETLRSHPFRPFGEDTWLGAINSFRGYRMVHECHGNVFTHAPSTLCSFSSRIQGYGATSLWKQRAKRWYVTNFSLLHIRLLQFFTRLPKHSPVSRLQEIVYRSELLLQPLWHFMHLLWVPSITFRCFVYFSLPEQIIAALALYALLLFHFYVVSALGFPKEQRKGDILFSYPLFYLFLSLTEVYASWYALLVYIPMFPSKIGRYTSRTELLKTLQKTAVEASTKSVDETKQTLRKFLKMKPGDADNNQLVYHYIAGRLVNAIEKYPGVLGAPLSKIGFARTSGEVREQCNYRCADFFILGASKCGTTSLSRHLLAHRKISFLSRLGGESCSRTFLEQDVSRLTCDNMDALECHIYDKRHASVSFMHALNRLYTPQDDGGGSKLGHYTPHYLYHPSVPFNIRDTYTAESLKALKFIVMLREPVSRAVSSWKYKVQCGKEHRSLEKAIKEGMFQVTSSERMLSLKDFQIGSETFRNHWESAILDAPGRTCSPFKDHVGKGVYSLQLELWFSIFSNREHYKFIPLESLRDRPKNTVRDVLEFVGLESTEECNQSTQIRYNGSKPSGVKLSAEDLRAIERLKEFYRPYNEKLYAMIGRKLGW